MPAPDEYCVPGWSLAHHQAKTHRGAAAENLLPCQRVGGEQRYQVLGHRHNNAVDCQAAAAELAGRACRVQARGFDDAIQEDLDGRPLWKLRRRTKESAIMLLRQSAAPL